MAKEEHPVDITCPRCNGTGHIMPSAKDEEETNGQEDELHFGGWVRVMG